MCVSLCASLVSCNQCAGLVAGLTYGSAPGASVVSVRVGDCDGKIAWDAIVQGVQWVVRDSQVRHT